LKDSIARYCGKMVFNRWEHHIDESLVLSKVQINDKLRSARTLNDHIRV